MEEHHPEVGREPRRQVVPVVGVVQEPLGRRGGPDLEGVLLGRRGADLLLGGEDQAYLDRGRKYAYACVLAELFVWHEFGINEVPGIPNLQYLATYCQYYFTAYIFLQGKCKGSFKGLH